MKKCMIGERYGSLVVIEKVKLPGKLKTYWRCRCDCGNTCTVEDSHLKNGHTKSCGCRRRIRLQEKRLDLTGQRYGRLVVLGPAAGTAEKCDGAVEQSGSSEGDRPKGIARIVRSSRSIQKRKQPMESLHWLSGKILQSWQLRNL